MTAVLHRNLSTPRYAVAGAGSKVISHEIDAIDLSAGAGSLCLGYSHLPVVRAMHDQVYGLPYVHAANWTCDVVEAFAADLRAAAANPLSSLSNTFRDSAVMFLNSGAEAVEAACKIAVQYFAEVMPASPAAFVAREHSYHGNTFFTLALGDHPLKTKFQYVTKDVPVVRVPGHLPSYDAAPDHEGSHRYRDYLKSYLDGRLKILVDQRLSPVVVMETVGGTTVGIEPADAFYLADVREVCDAYNALLIYDEVLCGQFRTGHLFAWQYYQMLTSRNVAPDIIACGKGLTAGYFPLSAVIVSGKVRNAIANGSHRLWHSTTNQNHPIGCAAGIAALASYRELRNNIINLKRALNEICPVYVAAHPAVIDVRQVGTLVGIRLHPLNVGLHALVRAAALEAGVSVYTEGGTINGKGNFIMLAPAYTISRETLMDGIMRLLKVLDGAPK